VLDDDEAAIGALLNAYCERLDSGDLDGVAALFDRGALRTDVGTDLVGRDAVRSLYDGVILYDDGTPRTKHVLGTVIIDVDAERRTASSRCAFTVFQAVPGTALQPVLTGRYHDRFHRDSDGWWYTERMIYPDLAGDLSRHMRPPA